MIKAKRKSVKNIFGYLIIFVFLFDFLALGEGGKSEPAIRRMRIVYQQWTIELLEDQSGYLQYKRKKEREYRVSIPLGMFNIFDLQEKCMKKVEKLSTEHKDRVGPYLFRGLTDASLEELGKRPLVIMAYDKKENTPNKEADFFALNYRRLVWGIIDRVIKSQKGKKIESSYKRKSFKKISNAWEARKKRENYKLDPKMFDDHYSLEQNLKRLPASSECNAIKCILSKNWSFYIEGNGDAVIRCGKIGAMFIRNGFGFENFYNQAAVAAGARRDFLQKENTKYKMFLDFNLVLNNGASFFYGVQDEKLMMKVAEELVELCHEKEVSFYSYKLKGRTHFKKPFFQAWTKFKMKENQNTSSKHKKVVF